LPPLQDGLLPWWKRLELLLEVTPLSNKRRHFLKSGSVLLPFFLAGLDGEGEDGASDSAAMCWSHGGNRKIKILGRN
jgi:hypothetical protein